MLYTTRNNFNKPEGTDYIDISFLNANWDAIDVMVSKHNLNAATAPTVNDDSADGYSIGSMWYDLTNSIIYTAKDVTIGAAVWLKIYAADPSTYATVASLANYVKLDGSNNFSAGVTLAQIATPAAPAANLTKFYTKSDGLLYYIVNGGAETRVGILDHGELTGLGDDDHTQYILHSLATAANDFLVASGSGTFVKKTLAETKTILGASVAFWNKFPGTPTRISNTSFSVTDTSNNDKYDLMFAPGTVIKWTPSGGGVAFAVITAAVYGTNIVTYTIIGNTLAADFTDMKYCIHRAMEDIFIVPGTLPAAASANIGKTIFWREARYVFSGLVRYITAATTTGGVWDVNDDGTSIFSGSIPIAATATKGTETVSNSLSGTNLTAVDAESLITCDYVSGHATTPGSDAYVYVWSMPVAWRYLS